MTTKNKKEIIIKPAFILQIFLYRVLIPYVILFIVFVIDALDGDIDDGYLDSNFYIITAIMTALLSFILLPYRKAIYRNTSYTFNKNNIIIKSTFPVKSEKFIKYSNITNVLVTQNWMQKFWNTGLLLLVTDNSNNYRFLNIDKATEVQKLIHIMCDSLLENKNLTVLNNEEKEVLLT